MPEKRTLPLLLLSAAATTVVCGRDFHVAPGGDDGWEGTDERPLRTIQLAAERLRPGDRCLIHTGAYRETVRPAASGTAAQPIVFMAAPGEEALMLGTEPVTNWVPHKGMLWRAEVQWPVEQLFVDGCLMIHARYPDRGHTPFDPAFISVGAEGANVWGDALDQPANAWSGATIWGFSQRLGWVSGTAGVVSSEPGRLVLDRKAPWYGGGAGRAVLCGVAAALTVAREWYQRDGVVYFWPPGLEPPTTLGVEVTRRRWAFDLSRRSHVHVRGILMYAASVNMNAATNCVLDRLYVRYASHEKNVRGGFNRDSRIGMGAPGIGIALSGRGNAVRNSVVSRCTGDGISIWGVSNTVANCVIYDCNTSGTDCAPITCTGYGHTILSNTLFNAGRSVILHRHLSRGKILHNHLYNGGLLCRDLGMTYTYQTDGRGTEIAYNLIHDNRARPPAGVGIYIDDMSRRHVIHHNLVFNTPEAMAMNPPNAHRNLVFNNTLIGELAGIGMGRHGPQSLTGTRFFNNIFRPHISMQATRSPSARLTNNIDHARMEHFTAPGRGDYTLRAGSAAVDAGSEFPPYTDGFSGRAPDLGAFERGRPAWQAGSSIPESSWGLLAPW